MKTQYSLARDLRNKWVAGVCAGFARYFGIDVNLTRLICLVLMLAYPGLILIYILLAFIMPVAQDENDYAEPAATETDYTGDETFDKEGTSQDGNILLGILLITAGVIFLFDQFFRWLGWQQLWPLILILVGLYLLLDAFGKKDKNKNNDDLSDDIMNAGYVDTSAENQTDENNKTQDHE